MCIYSIKTETVNNNNDIVVSEHTDNIIIPKLKLLSASGKCHVCIARLQVTHGLNLLILSSMMNISIRTHKTQHAIYAVKLS